MKGGGYGLPVDVILGILGAIIVSFVGAVILVAITRLLKRA